MRRINETLWILLGLLLAVPLLAAGAPDQRQLRSGLERLLPGLEVGEIRAAPVEGLYEVVLGSRIVYVSGDGRYLLQGPLIDLAQQKNLTAPRLRQMKAEVVASLDESRMVIFGPEDARHTITVFTDIDCGYCRKLHSEIDQYTGRGIRVRYLFYPRAGVGSSSYDKAVSVWCADDRKRAMTLAKAGKPIEQRDCPNPVKEDLALGERMGVNGTPAILLQNGEMIPGYVPAERLLRILEATEKGG